jgi:hypothetical protein
MYASRLIVSLYLLLDTGFAGTLNSNGGEKSHLQQKQRSVELEIHVDIPLMYSVLHQSLIACFTPCVSHLTTLVLP